MSKFIWQSSAYVYIYIFIRIFCWFKFFISFSLSIHIGFGDFDFYGTDTHNALYKLFQTHTQSKTSYINHCKALKLVECSRHKETKRWKHDTSYPLSISFWRDSVTKKKEKNLSQKIWKNDCRMEKDTMQTSHTFSAHTQCQRLFIQQTVYAPSMFVASPSQRKHSKVHVWIYEKKKKIFYDYLGIEWRTSSILAPNWNHIVPVVDCRIRFRSKQWATVNRKMIRVSMCPSRSPKTEKVQLLKLAEAMWTWLPDCRKGFRIITNINVVNDRFMNAFWNLELVGFSYLVCFGSNQEILCFREKYWDFLPR